MQPPVFQLFLRFNLYAEFVPPHDQGLVDIVYGDADMRHLLEGWP